jgi:hypothetical protein
VIPYHILTVGFARVRSLSIILQDVNIVLLQGDLTDGKAESLRGIAEGCSEVLETLDKTLEKYQELSPNPKRSEPKGLSFNFRRAWKRLKWEPEDIKKLRERIMSNISLLNAFYGQLTR